MKKIKPQVDMLTRILVMSAIGLTILGSVFAFYFFIYR